MSHDSCKNRLREDVRWTHYRRVGGGWGEGGGRLRVGGRLWWKNGGGLCGLNVIVGKCSVVWGGLGIWEKLEKKKTQCFYVSLTICLYR